MEITSLSNSGNSYDDKANLIISQLSLSQDVEKLAIVVELVKSLPITLLKYLKTITEECINEAQSSSTAINSNNYASDYRYLQSQQQTRKIINSFGSRKGSPQKASSSIMFMKINETNDERNELNDTAESSSANNNQEISSESEIDSKSGTLFVKANFDSFTESIIEEQANKMSK